MDGADVDRSGEAEAIEDVSSPLGLFVPSRHVGHVWVAVARQRVQRVHPAPMKLRQGFDVGAVSRIIADTMDHAAPS
jgi:hypothetical protein